MHVSRATIYGLLRNEFVIDFAAPGHKGTKLIPESTLRRILEKRKKRFR